MIEWLFNRKREIPEKEVARISFRQQAVTGLISILSLFLCYQLKVLDSLHSSIIEASGVAFFSYGVLLRWVSYRTILKLTGRKKLPLAERPLYSHGPFRFHRHPFHMSFFLMASGCGLYISGHWLAAPLMFILLGSALHPLMKKNEEVLQQKYGDIYTYWCRRRFRLLPFFY